MYRIRRLILVLFFIKSAVSQTMEYRTYKTDKLLIDDKIVESKTISNVWHVVQIINDSVFMRRSFTKQKAGNNYFVSDTFFIQNNMIYQKFCDTLVLFFSKKYYRNDSIFMSFYRNGANNIFARKFIPLDSIFKYNFFHVFYFNYEEYRVFGSKNNCEITSDLSISSDTPNRLLEDPIIGFLGSGFDTAAINIMDVSYDKKFKRFYKKIYRKVH